MKKINLNKIRLFNNIKNNEVIIKAIELIELLDKNTNEVSEFENKYFQLQNSLIQEFYSEDYYSDLWKGYIVKQLAGSFNPFSFSCEKDGNIDGLSKIAVIDLQIIKEIYNINWTEIGNKFSDPNPVFLLDGESSNRKTIHNALSKDKIEDTVTNISKYYSTKGCGLFEEYEAFRWNNGLAGINSYDTIEFEDLKGYKTQKKTLIENTEFLMNGLKANNVLLYGDRGTGKSSSVKALLNRYKDKKLKIVEVTKEQFFEFGRILDLVKDRGYKFLIFIDDLSFEDFEIEYKHFKAVLEGGLEVRPENVVIYVTTNRRNLIKENWKDQMNASGDEIHISDSVQEKLSLADRFGLTITYPAPDKELFLEIVKQKTIEAGVSIKEEILFEEALIWEMRNHGRSGRTAAQFTDYIVSKYNQEKAKGE